MRDERITGSTFDAARPTWAGLVMTRFVGMVTDRPFAAIHFAARCVQKHQTGFQAARTFTSTPESRVEFGGSFGTANAILVGYGLCERSIQTKREADYATQILCVGPFGVGAVVH